MGGGVHDSYLHILVRTGGIFYFPWPGPGPGPGNGIAIGLYRENAIAIQKESGDSNEGKV